MSDWLVLFAVNFRRDTSEFLLENFAGDLEYHPRRALLYLSLATAVLCLWIFSPSETKFTAIPLVFALGTLTLLLKGIFLLRKSSEGLGLSEQELANLSSSTNRKRLPSIATQVAQIVQDFGTGAFLLWPFSTSVRISTIPGTTRRVFPSFSPAQSSSCSAGLCAASLLPRSDPSGCVVGYSSISNNAGPCQVFFSFFPQLL